VRDDQLVLLGDRRQVVTREPDVLTLIFHRHRLAPAQERVTAEGYHDSHSLPPSLRATYPGYPGSPGGRQGSTGTGDDLPQSTL
jgi:hypothetical protein